MRLCSAGRSEHLKHWLLHAPIQQAHGEHRGAVAGWLHEDDRPAFLYGEVTGYYLTCGSFMGRDADAEPLRQRLHDAERWLHDVWSTPPPPTRHHLWRTEPDWRNEAVFSFDCAMMLRGLNGFDSERARRSRRAIETMLLRAIGPDGTLGCHVPHSATGGALPERWSTVRGPYQLKTAAAVLSAPGLGPALRDAAEATAATWFEWYRDREPAGGLHPLFYHLEGLLLLGAQRREWARWRLAADVLANVIEQRRSPGRSATDAPARWEARSDVTAQALRLGCLLVEGGFLGGARWERCLRDLADDLAGYVDANGGVRFGRNNGHAAHVNVWCTVFAYQAFALFERAGRANAVDDTILAAIA